MTYKPFPESVIYLTWKLYEETGLTGEIIAETEENRAVAVYSYE